MRRVDAEGDSRGVRGQKQAEARSRSRLRRASIEPLERRELLSTSTSTLPSPTVLSAPDLTKLIQAVSFSAGDPLINSPTEVPSANSPSVSVDPTNSLHMVATWVDHDTTGFQPGFFTAPITSYIQGAFSTNGGASWTALPAAAFGFNGGVNVQQDFSVTPPTNTVTVFTQTTDASIAFDRLGNFYLLSSTHNDANTAGILDLQRFTFTGNTPTFNGVTRIYSWDMADSAMNSGTVDRVVTPTLAVDTNIGSFTDPTSGKTQTDAFSGNIYAVWAEVDSNTFGGIGNFNPNTVRMAASSDQGMHFTHAAYVDNSSNAQNGGGHSSSARYAAPQVTISEGTSTVSGGQVTIVYDDFGSQAPLDRILVQNDAVGGTSQQFSPDPSLLGPSTFQTAIINNTTVVVAQNLNTQIPINVTIPATTNNNVAFSLSSLDVSTTVQFDTLAALGVSLVPSPNVDAFLRALFPATSQTPYNGVIPLELAGQLAGANLGGTSGGGVSGTGAGTVFDTGAIRSIGDGNTKGPAVGHFRPAGFGTLFLNALQGLSPATLNGTWGFQATFNPAAYTATTLRDVNSVTLNFSSGNKPGFNPTSSTFTPEVTVADRNTAYVANVPNINPTNPAAATALGYASLIHQAAMDGVVGDGVSGSGSYTATTQGAIPILPAPVIASDNTLGSFSAHQGRIYVSFTGSLFNTRSNTFIAQAGNSDVFLAFSDNGGRTWSVATQVNDDNAATDGYSGSAANPVNIGGTPTILGRTQYQPQVAVDQSTGSLVLSFLDARNDPSNARVATYIAASTDGGATFAADVYANATQLATDAVSGNPSVSLGPIPDNQSSVGGLQDTSGYGTHQALIVVNGRIIPFWASNENTAASLPGQVVPRHLTIVDSILSLAGGPRIIASTQGPVGLGGDTVNTTRAADGTTLANTIQITFDRRVTPAATITALMANTSVFYKSPSGGASILLPVTNVVALNTNALGATQFAITFNPGGLTSFVGTYSYVIKPTGISDRVRHTITGGAIGNGNVMDQNANGTTGEVPGDDYVVGQPTGFTSYAAGTLPLIVPGTHLLSSAAIDANGNVIGTGLSDLVLNNSVSGLQVLFDRNIQVSSFNTLNAAQVILGIFGPTEQPVSLAGITITPLSVFTNAGQMGYAGGATANLFRITFATQQISGSYSMTIGTGIVAADGTGVDANVNAGLDVLRGTATGGVTVPVSYTSTAVPGTIAPVIVNSDGSTTPSELITPIVVPDDFPIQPDTASVSTVTLSLNITYPHDPDLIAYLLAPDGVTKVNLFSGVGAGTNTANFTSTTFSDAASTSIDKAGAPFFGTFLPEGAFGNLFTAGLTSFGTWTLHIFNNGNSTGTLSSYSLTFQKPVSATGLAEFPNDQTTVNFQVFNLAATNNLANSTWTAVGPAGITPSSGKGTVAGAISTIAVDPSDTTGNTVYAGTASGGVWKTTNFLTTNAGGPTWLPLTDFGPSFTLNIGGIAAFGRNNDPAQTIIFAGTGFGQQRTNDTAGDPNVDYNTGIGGGMLRSMDGGKTWEVVGPFAGASTYKVVVDPTPNLNNQAIVYAATSIGLYQSLDSGNTWKSLNPVPGQPANATDIILDPASKSPTTGNLDRIYASFSNVTGFSNGAFAYSGPVGVYVSTNQGQTFLPVNGQLGKDPLLVTPGFPANPLPVGNSVTPNNINSAYIVLGKPALTGNTAENLNFEGWLYAAVENYNGTFQGLYVTKDAGENWTLVQLPNIPGSGSVKAAVPSAATANTNTYDPTSSKFAQQGMYNLTLTVDPTNPNIVYLGGSQDFQYSGLIRVNLTDLYDAHNFTSFANNRSDGGLLNEAAQGGINVTNPAAGPSTYVPIGSPPQSQILNLRYAPNNGTPGTSPFNINATLVIANGANGFINDGTGVTWSLFDEPLKANAGDVTGSTNLHSVIDYVDPITGDVRMLYADDLGIFTALVNPDGTLNNGIGSDVAPNYSRNGNLQNEQFFKSAAQPSKAASTAAGALFYASGQSTIAAQSDPNVLTDGNLTWDNSAVLSAQGTNSARDTTANSSIHSSDRSGVGIATNQNPGSTGANQAVYEFDVPILGGNLTDFFRVNQFGQTTGLANNVNQEFPANGYRGDAHQAGVQVNPVTDIAPGINGAIVNGQIPMGNFTVNPLNGNQILISSATGKLYETTNQGILWTPIGSPADFGSFADVGDDNPNGDDGNTDGSAADAPIPIQISAIAYGAPDPNASGGVGNLNNFIYAGTSGVNFSPWDPSKPHETDADGLLFSDGHIFVTRAGGQGWTDISRGLDGSSIVGIYPSPDRGSHAAYAVTLTGVFYSPDTITTPWTNITSNIPALQRAVYGNPANLQSVLAGFSYTPVNPTAGNPPVFTNLSPAPVYNPVYNAAYGGLTGIVADYRYEIPAATNATQGTNIFFPVLYASGYGGVFRSIDNGTTWTVFPEMNFDGAPADGGYLPNVDVTNLQLVLGSINPDTGHAVQTTGDPEVLLATTFGRGDYAIRLAPDIIPNSIAFDQNLPSPGGSDSGISNTDLITNVLEPYIDGISELSNFGNTVTINLFDESPGPGFGKLLGTGTTNQLGQFTVQIVKGTDPSFFMDSTAPGDKIVGIQATDSAGASGNMTLFKYTLATKTPNIPEIPSLEATYDTGRFNNDDLSNLSVPPQAGPGAPLTIAVPIFDVTTALPQANPLTPNPISLTVELLRATSPTGPFFLIDSTQTGFINSGGTSETYMLMDADVAAQAAAGINQTFYYEALQVDAAGNVSDTASNVLTVTIDTIAPVAPTGLSLVTLSTTSPPQPVFNVTGVLPNDQVLLYRSINGGAPIQVGAGAINITNGVVTLPVTDTAGAFPDGVYTYFAAQLDVYGNFSPLTSGLVVVINTQTPPAAPILEPAFDTGRFNNDDVTDIAVPAPTPGSAPNFVVPVFDVNTFPAPTGQPPISSVQLFRSNSPNGPFTLVGTTLFSGNPAMVTDASLQTLASAGPINQTFYYEANEINSAGIQSAKSPALAVLVDTITPPTLPAPALDPASNTGLIKTQLITNITKPLIDFTGLLPGEQAFLYRSTGGNAPILVGTGPINTTSTPLSGSVADTIGAIPDGVYQYFVVQQDLAGNISNFSMAVTVTINTTVPTAPTINLLMSDDSGLPSHPNVTKVRTPHFNGTAQFNSGTNFPLDILNVVTGQVLASTFPAANGTYLAQIMTPLPDGVYVLIARTRNLAGTPSYSAPLTITIKATGPMIPPNLILFPADDTGIKGDGVTSNHNPRFTGVTDPGDTVTLYALINGQLIGPEATTTSSAIKGSSTGTFTFKLPFNLTDGTTQLVAQTTDIANNKGPFSSPFTVRISSTTGDYLAVGAAQLTVFDPLSETYYVQNVGAVKVDTTPGRDVPIQYDLNGDGITDLSAYRFNTAEYFGFVSNNTMVDQQFGSAGAALPVSGYFGGSGTYIYGAYLPSIGVWAVSLPQPGGLVVHFGVAKVDIPTPAAFDGNGSTELAVFRPTTIAGFDADSYTVIGPNGIYVASFTNPGIPVAARSGYTYKAGDMPAPADYDGIGKDEFAIYRPSTGQFFILSTPTITNAATWSIRTVTLNLPGGPNAADVPATEDYDGNGKADPTVYRPTNSTFYVIHSSTGFQQNIAFGAPNQFIAAAGPLLYRLTALKGVYSSNGGYLGAPGGGPGSSVHALSIGSATTNPTPSSASSSPFSTMIALASPIAVTTPTVPVASSATPPKYAVTVGASTPRTFTPVVSTSNPGAAVGSHQSKAKKVSKPLTVDSKSHQAEAKATAGHVKTSRAPAKSHATTSSKSHATSAGMAVTSLQHLVMAMKGRKKD
jgi:subtilisin-like proprotein convertase family protein